MRQKISWEPATTLGKRISEGIKLVDRHAYYSITHPQTIEFEIAREIIRALTDAAQPGKKSLRRQSRSTLLPNFCLAGTPI
jgi:hypothetical protein